MPGVNYRFMKMMKDMKMFWKDYFGIKVMQVGGSIDENVVAGGKGWGGDWMRRTV